MRKALHPVRSSWRQRLFALLASSVFAFATAQAATAEPRAAVVEVATAVEARFYDAARAQRIGAELRAEADQGRYDRYRDPRDLANALSERLRALDGHFRVDWRQPDPAVATPGPASAEAGPARVDFSRRRNYGLRKVEVLPGNLGYIDLREFPDFAFGDPAAPARRALDAALQLTAATDAVIVDLRDNGGGSPAAVGYLVSAFTPRGADIYNTFRWREGGGSRSQSEAPAEAYPEPRLQVPLYVLISARTGSAAEALAYTLQSAGRARVVGEASAGSANPGEQIALKDGFSVFVATGSPTNPITRRNWEGSGVTPDVAVPPQQALRTAQTLALEQVLTLPRSAAEALDTRWTLEALRAETAAQPYRARNADYLGQYGRIQIGEDGGHLFLRDGKRPAQTLIALQRDLFCVAANPGVRVRFERDGEDRSRALEVLRADGGSSRFRR